MQAANSSGVSETRQLDKFRPFAPDFFLEAYMSSGCDHSGKINMVRHKRQLLKYCLAKHTLCLSGEPQNGHSAINSLL